MPARPAYTGFTVKLPEGGRMNFRVLQVGTYVHPDQVLDTYRTWVEPTRSAILTGVYRSAAGVVAEVKFAGQTYYGSRNEWLCREAVAGRMGPFHPLAEPRSVESHPYIVFQI